MPLFEMNLLKPDKKNLSTCFLIFTSEILVYIGYFHFRTNLQLDSGKVVLVLQPDCFVDE